MGLDRSMRNPAPFHDDRFHHNVGGSIRMLIPSSFGIPRGASIPEPLPTKRANSSHAGARLSGCPSWSDDPGIRPRRRPRPGNFLGSGRLSADANSPGSVDRCLRSFPSQSRLPDPPLECLLRRSSSGPNKEDIEVQRNDTRIAYPSHFAKICRETAQITPQKTTERKYRYFCYSLPEARPIVTRT